MKASPSVENKLRDATAHLDPDLSTNKYRYFFFLMGPRFDATAEMMAKSLERKTGKPHKPIFVYLGFPNEHYVKDNYIVINKQALRIAERTGLSTIYLPEYEDLNLEFLASDVVADITKKLSKKQPEVFVHALTSSFLEKISPPLRVVGPEPMLATRLDSKIEQYKLFCQLGLPVIKAEVVTTMQGVTDAVGERAPRFVSASYTSGGYESGIFFDTPMLKKFFNKVRSANHKRPFLVSDVFFNLTHAPNVNAIVLGEDDVRVLFIADQILHGNRYLGNVYPTSVDSKHQSEIISITEKIGKHIAKEGYRGLFGCDFLIDSDGQMVIVDLNPRRQGAYGCQALALQSTGYNLTDLELACALGEETDSDISMTATKGMPAWAHSKLTPPSQGQVIERTFKKSDPVEVFSGKSNLHRGIFYREKSIVVEGYIGYVLLTGKGPENLERELSKQVDISLDQCLAPRV